MANELGYTLTSEAVQDVTQLVRDFRQRFGAHGERRRVPFSNRQPLLEGILDDDLDAASDSLTGATSGTLRLMRGDALSDETLTVVNRYLDWTLQAGTYCVVGWANGGWRILSADCTAGANGGSAGSSSEYSAGGTFSGGSLMGGG